MTSVRDAAASTGAGEESEQLRQVLVAVMFSDVSIGVRLDAAAAIGIQTPPRAAAAGLCAGSTGHL